MTIDKTNNNTYDNLKDFTIKELIENLKENTELEVNVEEDARSKDTMDEDTAKNIVQNFANKYGINNRSALVVITKFVQDGGSNSSRPNMTRRLFGKEFELGDLRQAIRLHDKYGTVRKLAKTLRSVIATIAITNNWPGPLYKDIQRINPTLVISDRDAVYCAEFNSDNYDTEMPAKIREALQQREQKIRDDRNRFMFRKTKTNQGKRKRGRNNRYK